MIIVGVGLAFSVTAAHMCLRLRHGRPFHGAPKSQGMSSRFIKQARSRKRRTLLHQKTLKKKNLAGSKHGDGYFEDLENEAATMKGMPTFKAGDFRMSRFVNGLSWVNIPDMERAKSMLRKAPRSRDEEEIEWFSCAYPANNFP